jgi:hypothetical protein
MEFKTLLSVLKYTSYIVAASSTIWGLTHELYVKDEQGRRRLVRAGRIALGITILSLLVSLNTTALDGFIQYQDENDKKRQDSINALAREQHENAIEQKRRDEALAQQQRDEALVQQQREDARSIKEQGEVVARKQAEEAAQSEHREVIRLGRLLGRQETTLYNVSRIINPLTPIAVEASIEYHLKGDPRFSEYFKRVRAEAQSCVNQLKRYLTPNLDLRNLIPCGKGASIYLGKSTTSNELYEPIKVNIHGLSSLFPNEGPSEQLMNPISFELHFLRSLPRSEKEAEELDSLDFEGILWAPHHPPRFGYEAALSRYSKTNMTLGLYVDLMEETVLEYFYTEAVDRSLQEPHGEIKIYSVMDLPGNIMAVRFRHTIDNVKAPIIRRLSLRVGRDHATLISLDVARLEVFKPQESKTYYTYAFRKEDIGAK